MKTIELTTSEYTLTGLVWNFHVLLMFLISYKKQNALDTVAISIKQKKSPPSKTSGVVVVADGISLILYTCSIQIELGLTNTSTS